MEAHIETIQIIERFGMKAKKVAEIIGKSQSVIYDKIKQNNTRFFEDELIKLKAYIKNETNKL